MKKKYSIHAIFIIFISTLIHVSCTGESERPAADVQGEWIVVERWFEDCNDADVMADINYQLKIHKANAGKNLLIFKEKDYEEQIFWEKNGVDMSTQLKGEYEWGEGRKSLEIESGSLNWSFSLKLIDPNLEHMLAVRQLMNKDDIEKIYYRYFGIPGRVVADDVTGVMVTKAARIK